MPSILLASPISFSTALRGMTIHAHSLITFHAMAIPAYPQPGDMNCVLGCVGTWDGSVALAVRTVAFQPPRFHIGEGWVAALGRQMPTNQATTKHDNGTSTTRAFRGPVGPSDASLRTYCFSAHIVSFDHEHHAISPVTTMTLIGDPRLAVSKRPFFLHVQANRKLHAIACFCLQIYHSLTPSFAVKEPQSGIDHVQCSCRWFRSS